MAHRSLVIVRDIRYPANRLEAIREMKSDEKEGADFTMVKNPWLFVVDIIRDVRNNTNFTGCLQRFCEYAMVVLQRQLTAGSMKNDRVNEVLVGLKRWVLD